MKPFCNLATLVAAFLVFNVCADSNAPPKFHFKGTVVDLSGQPVDGATVESYVFPRGSIFSGGDAESKQRLTATNGVFDVELSPEGALVLARKPGLAPTWRMFWSVTSDTEGRLTLSQPANLSGKVVDENDRPVANAEVYVAFASVQVELEGGARTVSYLSGKPARGNFSTRTSADGQFQITGFPTNASAELMVEVPGKALRQESRESYSPNALSCHAGQEDIRLLVEPAGTVEGKIVAQDQTRPVPVARLTLQPDRGGFSIAPSRDPIESRADGSFRLTDVAAGNYRLRAVFGTNALPEWVAETVSVSVEAGQTNANVQLTATRGGLLEVAVVGKKQREPLAAVSVNVYRQDYQAAARSENNGLALLRLPPGEFQLSATRDNSRTENTTATVELGKTNRLELELPAPVKLTGIVRRPDGQPAAGAELRIVGAFGGSTTVPKAGADGKFELPFNPQQYGPSERSYCLFVRDPEHNLAVAEEVDEETGPLDLRLAPGLTLVGRAECDGAPLTNATAALVFWSGNSGMHLYGMAVGTNTPGRFELPALAPGRRYGLYVSAPGYGQKYVNLTESLDEPKRVELDPVELKPANQILAGQVVDADDKPVSGASIHLSGEGQPNANTTSDRQGRFTFKSVCEGPVRLFANARNATANMSAEGGDTNVVVKLGESSVRYSSGSTTHRLKGTVTDPDGRPVNGAQVSVFPAHSSWVKTSASGAFSLNWRLEQWQMQQGGDPCLVVRDLARNLGAAEDLTEETTNVTVRLKPALTVSARVEDPAGLPLANAEIGVWLEACRSRNALNQQPVRPDTQGRFEVKTLPFGPKYFVFASAKDHGRIERELELDSSTNHLELPPFVLKLTDQVIAGQVMNEQDKPVAGIQVSLSGEGQPQTSTTTDRQGRFQFKVCEGNAQIYASSQNGYGNLNAEAGETNLILQLRNYGAPSRAVVKRASMKGKPLPDLAAFGLAAGALPVGKQVLVCLIDAEQRPSRRFTRLLTEQHDALCQKGLTVLAIQAAPVSAETLQAWTNSAPLPFPLGCVKEKSANTRWATEVESLPWLMLRDAKGNITAEGFALEELGAKLNDSK